jgi:hypothetical protein
LEIHGKTIGIVKANSKGRFALAIKPLSAGTVVAGTVVDQNGLVSNTVTVTVRDVIPPSAPKVNSVYSNDKVVTGNTEVGAVVTVNAGSKELGTANASAAGNFKVNITAQKAGTKLTVTASDKAGNTSKATKVTVKK